MTAYNLRESDRAAYRTYLLGVTSSPMMVSLIQKALEVHGGELEPAIGNVAELLLLEELKRFGVESDVRSEPEQQELPYSEPPPRPWHQAVEGEAPHEPGAYTATATLEAAPAKPKLDLKLRADIAREALVCERSVERVITGSQPVSEYTRARVLAGIERLGLKDTLPGVSAG